MQTSTPERAVHRAVRRPRRRWPVRIAWLVAGLVLVGYAGIGWYVSGEIISGMEVERANVEYDTGVVSIGDGMVTLAVSDEASVAADRNAVMGLRWDGGYAQVGPVIRFDAETETRRFTLLEGSLPTVGDDVADMDSFAFAGDPSDLGVAFETVTFPAPLGDLEAWMIPGESDTWIVAVHGLGATRAEFLRTIEALSGEGYPMLVITYRNDEGAPSTGDSLIKAGQDEWTDVAAAVDYATSRGASDVVLFGSSMGGALVLGHLVETDTPELVRGAVLESPVADLREVISLRSGEALPVGGIVGDSMLAVGRAFAWLRTGIDFDDVDYVDRATELTTPILLFHGTADDRIPFEVGESLADAAPALIEFHPLDEAAHVRAWNEGPDTYRQVVSEFLAGVSGG